MAIGLQRNPTEEYRSMLRNPIFSIAGVLIGASTFCPNAFGQNVPAPPPEPSRTVPVDTVTVMERSLQAVNYEYRSMPTDIDFRGTVLLPNSKDNATIESK